MVCLQSAYETTLVGKAFEGNKVFDIAVTLLPEQRTNIMAISELPIKTLDGTIIKLVQVADIKPNTGRYNILRQNSQRKQTITASIVEGDMDVFMNTMKSRILKEIPFTADTYPEFTGAAIEQAKARTKLILHSLFAGAGVLILIYIAIGNLRQVLLTLANLPFALIGGIAAVILTGAPLINRLCCRFYNLIWDYRT